MDFNTDSAIVNLDHLEPIKFEDGSQKQVLGRIFEDGSFVCTTDESCLELTKISRRIQRWERRGKFRKIERFFNKNRDILTGLWYNKRGLNWPH